MMTLELVKPATLRDGNEAAGSGPLRDTRTSRGVLVKLVVVVAMLAAMLSLSTATAETAQAQSGCPNGMAVIDGMCGYFRQCRPGYEPLGGSCIQLVRRCSAGGYLSGTQCYIKFWGQWTSYPSTLSIRFGASTPYWQPIMPRR